MPHPPETVDCAIVGAGPAGVAAALEARRQGLSVALFERGEAGGQARVAHWILNLPGFPEGISGRDFAERLLHHLKHEGIPLRQEEVTQLARTGTGFLLTTPSAEVRANSVIVACGLKPRALRIPGEEELLGQRLFAYADPTRIPHAGLRIIVLGSGDAAFDQALAFRGQADSIAIAMKHASPRCVPRLAEEARRAGIELLPSHVATAIENCNEGIAIAFDDRGRRLRRGADIAIVCIGKEPQLEFLAPELREGKSPGLFFAGDCCRGLLRGIAIAAGDGAAAAMETALWLHEKPTTLDH